GVRPKKPRPSGTPNSLSSGNMVSGSNSGTHYGSEYGSLSNLASSSKRGARSKREAKSAWSISMWPDIDNPQGPAHMSREETHAAAQFVIESDRLTVWNDKGYRMAKASHGVETGAWYFEVDVLEPVRSEYNLRVGWSQISGELQAPCGFDVFSYSVRAKPSTRFHAAIGSPYGEEYAPGDTLGVLIYLPALDDDEKQDLADRKWRPGERYRQFTYSRPESQRPYNADNELPPMPVLAGSELVYFKNGKCLGPAFQKLYLGKYYPAISSYMGGKAKVNLGPTFKYPPPSTWHKDMTVRPISDLEFTLPAPEPEADKPPATEEQKPQLPLGDQQEAAAALPAEATAVKAEPLSTEPEPMETEPSEPAPMDAMLPETLPAEGVSAGKLPPALDLLAAPVKAETSEVPMKDVADSEQAALLHGLKSASLEAEPISAESEDAAPATASLPPLPTHAAPALDQDPSSLDKGRFGFKMLEKMGWSEGKGLGANEDGMKEHVKIKLKTNNFGIGADKKNIRNWLENADGFSELLSRLNSDTNTPSETANNDSDCEDADKKQRKKDEKKKKKRSKDVESKSDSDTVDTTTVEGAERTETVLNAASVRLNRLSHRTRFRNMKKMALQDEKGLQEIFGVRSAPSTFANTPDAKQQSESPSVQSGVSTPVPSQTTTQTVETGVSVSDYFAQKLAANPALAAIYGVEPVSAKPAVASSDLESSAEDVELETTTSKKRKAESIDSKKDKKRVKEDKKRAKEEKKAAKVSKKDKKDKREKGSKKSKSA
ncbi:transcription factor, contains a PHD finger motif, partial [Coemansia sp. RSA 2681]